MTIVEAVPFQVLIYLALTVNDLAIDIIDIRNFTVKSCFKVIKCLRDW